MPEEASRGPPASATLICVTVRLTPKTEVFTQHALRSDLTPQLRDLEMIVQYQRMSHYGIAGFGTVAAYACALGMTEEATKLKSIVASIYKGDEYSSSLAETAQKTVAQA